MHDPADPQRLGRRERGHAAAAAELRSILANPQEKGQLIFTPDRAAAATSR